jgi:hypothetical protein
MIDIWDRKAVVAFAERLEQQRRERERWDRSLRRWAIATRLSLVTLFALFLVVML